MIVFVLPESAASGFAAAFAPVFPKLEGKWRLLEPGQLAALERIPRAGYVFLQASRYGKAQRALAAEGEDRLVAAGLPVWNRPSQVPQIQVLQRVWSVDRLNEVRYPAILRYESHLERRDSPPWESPEELEEAIVEAMLLGLDERALSILEAEPPGEPMAFWRVGAETVAANRAARTDPGHEAAAEEWFRSNGLDWAFAEFVEGPDGWRPWRCEDGPHAGAPCEAQVGTGGINRMSRALLRLHEEAGSGPEPVLGLRYELAGASISPSVK
jgi:hypothetical protein